MSAPVLSVVCPTIGRPTLAATLASVRAQASPAEVELLVIGDTYGDGFASALGSVPALCRQYAATYLEHNSGFHAYGHPQRAFGQTQARGDWLLFTQDDSAYLVGAFAAIRQAIQGPRGPCLFRVDTWQAGTVWREPVLRLGDIDADCLCVPREADKLQPWATDYTADYSHIVATCAVWSQEPRWLDAVISRGRPHERPAGGPPVAG